MNCPVDGTQLAMSEREGVEIDYCPSCRGIWLDRGELDKIIERDGERVVGSRGGKDEGEDEGRRGKRRSGLADLFDFGG